MPLVEINPRIQFRRGGPVEIGNVYQNRHGKPFFKILFGKKGQQSALHGRWNNCILVHVDAMGEVVGCSMAPELYIRDHHDFIGKIIEMPKLKMEWNKLDEPTSPSSSQSPASSRGKGRASASSKESEKS
jgi:hypothetical protein